MRRNNPRADKPLNVLLSNGRFPVTLDLARQLTLAGRRVYIADCMHYHVCKFSRDVKRSFRVPVPREDPDGFVEGVLRVIEDAAIDLVIPMHEEIFYLAEAAQTDPELRSKLLAPPFQTLVMLHNKWEFAKFLLRNSLGVPRSALCKSYEDIMGLDREVEWAVKPVYGRASTNIFHLKPGNPLPSREELDVSEENHYVAQEWICGDRYCTYSVWLNGRVAALSVYPVQETIDSSSCVYFKSIQKPEITAYVDKLAEALPGVSGQIALDVVHSDKYNQLVAIECNPRATSGIHLYARTSRLALVLTSHIPIDAPYTDTSPPIPDHVLAPIHAKRKLAPGMLMWKRAGTDKRYRAIAQEYLTHMKRLVFTADVIWSWRDLMPSLLQPFLVTSYYEICREKGLKLPTMFQYDLVWEPTGEHLERVRQLFGEGENDKKAEGDERSILDASLPLQ